MISFFFFFKKLRDRRGEWMNYDSFGGTSKHRCFR